MEIIDLPHDLFLLIIAHLSARAAVRCRRVSRRWRDTFTDGALCVQLLKWHFPRCREMRLFTFGELRTEEEQEEEEGQEDWTATFTTVARRYHHLGTATPRSVEKIRTGAGADTGGDWFFGVGTWDRYLRLDEKEAPFHYPDPSWCYSQELGVLVYHAQHQHHPRHEEDEDDDDVDQQQQQQQPPPPHQQENGNIVRAYYYPWRLLDLETRRTYEVPFPHDENERLVRRVRLHDGVLAVEWCEREAYHQLNDRERCHRHFVTAFDVVRNASGSGTTPSTTATKTTSKGTGEGTGEETTTWTITERAEWKLHFLGFPLNQHDRFFSAHTSRHYAVYVWQPNRSPWGEDDPIESVVLWDISPPSPSSTTTTTTTTTPRILRRLTWPTLSFHGVRQQATPSLRRLALDAHNLYFVEEEHRWARGGHSSLVPPRGHLVRCTGVPVIPFSSPPPPPPLTSSSSSFGTIPSSSPHQKGEDQKEEKEDGDEEGEEEVIVQGPRWFDQCGADGDASLSFCTRLHHEHDHDREQTYPGMSTSSSSELVEMNSHPRRHPLSSWYEEKEETTTSRWPGWAPCWRHEEFPYLTGTFSSVPYPLPLPFLFLFSTVFCSIHGHPH